jgi:MFS transporter, DHA2 family, multidrug resistance protein
MGSLPLAKAGVGSAMNDTTRQIGGALGVAILGSILASSYSSAMAPVVANLPAEAAGVAGDSIGGAAAVASQAGEAGAALMDAASAAFIGGMESAVWVAAGVVLLGAIITFRWLPARGRDHEEAAVTDTDDQPNLAAT